jgi:F5/8 type C domain
VKAALRREREEDYLSQDPDYNIVRMIGSVVPPKETIFAISQNGQSYLPRDLLIGYESASNEVLQDILWTPVVRAFQPTRRLTFNFPPRELRKLRVVQTASLPDDQWSMAELRVFNGNTELSRDPAWRLTAHPNPWEVQLAFDNSPITRWRSWQPAAPGMYVQVDFGRPQSASSVVVESAGETGATKIMLQGAGADGSWVTLSDHPVESRQPIRASLRLAATAELKARGIHYILIKPDNPGADDLRRYPGFWGLMPVGSVGDVRLFHIK